MTTAEWSLAELVRSHGRDRPDLPAITYGTEVISWRDLDDRSNRVASALVAAGIRKDDRIGFVGKNAPAYFEILFGASKAGIVVVAVNWRLNPAEIGFIVKDAGVMLAFVDAEFASEAAEMAGIAEAVVVIGSDSSTKLPDALGYDEWLAGHPASDPGHVGSQEDVALQLYTSGTTGLPKGAMLTNANFSVLYDGARAMFGIDADSVNIVVLPVFHIGGVGYALVGMAQGCHTILIRDFDPIAVLDALQVHHVTNTFFVPAMLAAFCAVPDAAAGDYSSLRSIIYGASPITDETLKLAIRTFRCNFFQVYGMTETTGAITRLAAEDHDPDGPRSGLLRSAGKPFDWVEVRIVDPDSGRDRPVGEVGELWTRSPQNMAGYWNNPEATRQAITSEGWLRTGDAGFVDEHAYIFLTDRVKDMIVSGGENVYPIEVENILATHPDVADVAVIGVPDEKWGETVKAIIMLQPGATPDPNAIIDFCRARIAHFKCPTSVDFTEVLPRNPSGKILKRELREPYWEGYSRRVG